MLTADELTAVRETQESALPDTAVVSRPTRVSDGAGGYTPGTPTVVATVAARATVTRPREIVSANQETALADWIVTLPHDVTVQKGDEIAVNGLTLIVIGPLPGAWSTAARIACVARSQ